MPRKPKAVTEPIKTCPFTGKELSVVKLSNGDFQLRGPGWIATTLFQTERQAWHWVSHRNGVAPDFPANELEIVGVREPPPPPDPLDGLQLANVGALDNIQVTRSAKEAKQGISVVAQ